MLTNTVDMEKWEVDTLEVGLRSQQKFTVTTAFRPDYACMTQVGGVGPSGMNGPSGSSGATGRMGAIGSSDRVGGAGGDGGPGSGGGHGLPGAPGPTLIAYATLVSTPHYEYLVALKIERDVSVLLAELPEGVTRH